MKLTIGCPVRSREWIMARWLTHIEIAAMVAGVEDIQYVFVGAPDDPTIPVIEENTTRPWRWVNSQEKVQADRTHQWNPSGYRHMTMLRNWLLQAARETEPDYFLSLDSDILIHEDALANMIETAQSGFDGVGGKCWMTPGTDACSYIILINSHGMHRPDVSTVIPVDVIMAIKLMNRKALGIDYCFDMDGEDVGWSRRATAAGLKLAFDGRVCSKHVMYRRTRNGQDALEAIDARCGF